MKPANDIIFIEGLRLPAKIGITAWEQQIHQTLILDLQLSMNSKKAAETNDIQYTVDYYQVVKYIESYVSTQSFQLIESFAEQITQIIMEKFAVTGVRLKVSKPSMVAQTTHVGLIIERGDIG